MKKLIYILLTTALFLIFAIPAFTTSRYAKNGGSDSGDCSDSGLPCESLSYANSQMSAGDTLYLWNASTWTGSTVLLTAIAGIDADNHTIYDGSTWGSGSRAILQATAAMNSVIAIAVSNVTIEGIDVDMNGQTTGGINIGYGAYSDIANFLINNCLVHDSVIVTPNYNYGIYVGGRSTSGIDVTNFVISNTVVHDTGHEGIAIYPTWTQNNCTAQNGLITGCTIYNTGKGSGSYDQGSYGDGIYIVNGSDEITVEHNNIYHCYRGLSVGNSSDGYPQEDLGHVIIRYNTFSDNYSVALRTIDGTPTYGWTSGDIEIYNNTFADGSWIGSSAHNLMEFKNPKYYSCSFKVYNNSFYAGYATGAYRGVILLYGLNGNTSTFLIKNNILFGINGYSVYARYNTDLTNFTFDYNLYYRSSGTNGVYIEDTGTIALVDIPTSFDTNAQITDPQYTTPGSDFTLQIGSPAIDNGTNLSGVGVTDDYVGTARPQGTAYDIGAYEFADLLGIFGGNGTPNISNTAP